MDYAHLTPEQLSAIERMQQQYRSEFGHDIVLVAFEPQANG